LDSLLELLLEEVFRYLELLNGGKSSEGLVGDDEEPVIFLEIRIVLRMNISASLALFEVMIINSEFASKNISYNDFILTLYESSHGEFDKRKGVNAFLLISETLVSFICSINERCNFFSLLTLKHAILEESFVVHLLLESLHCFIITEIWELTVWIFVNPATLHEVLRELNEGHNVLGGNFLWRSAHLVHLGEDHCLTQHNIEVRWDSAEDVFKVLLDSYVREIVGVENVVHVAHEEADGLDLDLSLLGRLGDGLLHLVEGSDSLQNGQLVLALDFHGTELVALGQDSGDLFADHVLVDQLREYFTVVDINASDVLLVGSNLVEEVAWDDEDHHDEEDDQYLHGVLLFLEHVWKGNADGEATLAIWVSVLEEVLTSLLVGHDGVGLGDLDELVDGLWIIRVLIWMLFSGQFPVSFLDLCDGSINFNTKELIWYKSLEWLNIFDDLEALVAEEPKECNSKEFANVGCIDPIEAINSLSFNHSLHAN